MHDNYFEDIELEAELYFRRASGGASRLLDEASLESILKTVINTVSS